MIRRQTVQDSGGEPERSEGNRTPRGNCDIGVSQ